MNEAAVAEQCVSRNGSVLSERLNGPSDPIGPSHRRFPEKTTWLRDMPLES